MAWLIKRGDVYYVGYNDGTKDRYKSTKTTDPEIAETKRLEMELVQRVGSGVIAEAPGMTLDTLIPLYIAATDVSERTIKSAGYSWKKFISLSKVVCLQDITPEVIKAFKKTAVSKEMSPAYLGWILKDMKKLMGYAADKGFIPKNPFSKVVMPEQEEVWRLITHEEEARLLAVAHPKLVTFIHMALKTGLRISQITGLTWKQVDLKNRTISVPKQKRQKARKIPIFDDVVSLLGTPKMSGLVFPDLKTDLLEKMFARARIRAGIPGRMRPHDLRHTCASRLAHILKPAEVRDFFGWSSIALVDRYVHTTVEGIRETMQNHRDQKEGI